MANPEFNQTKIHDYVITLILTLIPGLLIGIYGLTMCLFKNESKILKKAWFFKLISLIYFYFIGKGLYLIYYDWHYEHHHNHKMMSYVFYHDYAL